MFCVLGLGLKEAQEMAVGEVVDLVFGLVSLTRVLDFCAVAVGRDVGQDDAVTSVRVLRSAGRAAVQRFGEERVARRLLHVSGCVDVASSSEALAPRPAT